METMFLDDSANKARQSFYLSQLSQRIFHDNRNVGWWDD